VRKSTGADAPAPFPDGAPPRAHSSAAASAFPAGEARFAILIVEDNSVFREFLQRALHARFPRLALAAAGSLREALLRINAARPDLVFADVHLPDGRGFELARRIRQMSVDAKVVFLSGYDLPEYRAEAYRSGADHYLVKGRVSIDDIAALVNSTMASRGAA
jgi:DNA-binding NarL/FixJ family response regulator